MVQTVVEAHVTHNNFYSVWSNEKDRPTEPTYPAVFWDQWNARGIDEGYGLLRVQFVRLVIITSVATDRTPTQRDAAVEAADAAAFDIVAKLIADNGADAIGNVQVTTQFDEYTALETGVLLSFTVKSAGPCLDGTQFPTP